MLDAALLAFSRINAVQYIRKVLLYQASGQNKEVCVWIGKALVVAQMQVFHLIGYEAERDRCADEVKQWLVQGNTP